MNLFVIVLECTETSRKVYADMFLENATIFAENVLFFCPKNFFLAMTLARLYLALEHFCPCHRKGLSSESRPLTLEFLCLWP